MKLGHSRIQLRTLGVKYGQYPLPKKEHIANKEQMVYICFQRRFRPATFVPLANPRHKEHHYVRHCPAYRRRILHG